MAGREENQVRDPLVAGTDDFPEVTWGQVAAVGGILLGLALLAGWGIVGLAPDAAPAKEDPSFIDSIFANVVVIAAARVVLLAGAVVLLVAGVYIVLSTAVRIGRGQWLRRAGPFETDLAEQEQRLGEVEDFIEDSTELIDRNEELANRLAERDAEIEQLLRDRERLLQELKERDGT